MARVLVHRALKADRLYEVGDECDLDDAIIASLPEGTVSALAGAVVVDEPVPSSDNAVDVDGEPLQDVEAGVDDQA